MVRVKADWLCELRHRSGRTNSFTNCMTLHNCCSFYATESMVDICKPVENGNAENRDNPFEFAVYAGCTR